MQVQLFLFLSLLERGQGLSLHFEEGCEVRSVWKIPYTFNEYQLIFWTPPAGEDSRETLKIDIRFLGHIFPVTYDAIQVHRNETIFERVREGIRVIQRYPNPFAYPEGWTRLIFTIDEHFGIVYDDNVLFNASVEYIPESLQFEGSNVTVDCHSDARIWKSSKNPTTLPLTKADQHWLSFFSIQKFLPAIDLEMRRFLLGWDEGRLTTIPTKAQSLPPFIVHHIKLNCTWSVNGLCTVMIGENDSISEVLRLGDMPRTVTISEGGSDGSFYVFLHDRNKLSHPRTPEAKSENSFESCEAKKIVLINLAMLIFVLSTFALIITYSQSAQSCLLNIKCSKKTKTDEGSEKNHKLEVIPENNILIVCLSSPASGLSDAKLTLDSTKSKI